MAINKTLQRRKTRRHPLYLDGFMHLSHFFNDDAKKLDRLKNHWLHFCVWSISKSGRSANTLQDVDRDYVILYGNYLYDEFLSGRYSSTFVVSSAIAAINTLMKSVQPSWQKVSSKKDCGVDPKSYISNKKPLLTPEGLPDIASLAGYLFDLQCSLGLEMRDALSLNLRVALREGRTHGYIKVDSWRTGARRLVPCRPAAIKSLGEGIAALRLQKTLPQPWGYEQFLLAHNHIAGQKGYSTNNARGVYVRDRYQELTGLSTSSLSGVQDADPIIHLSNRLGISLSEAKHLDKQTRQTIAKEIGVLGTTFVDANLNNQTTATFRKEKS